MNRTGVLNTILPQKRLQLFFLSLLLLGIFFRFVNLDQKVYWCDETYTSLRISGYTAEEFVQQVFNRRIIDQETLHNYQRPNSNKTVVDTIKGLAAEEPQHSPLYYVIVRVWVKIFGSSVAVTRSLSAIISLLAFPCMYWLCQELFDSPITGWVGVTLLSVSSFHLLYAQEAREYSLWTVSILLASASLLRAIRKKTAFSWVVYSLTLALSLYSFLFSILMIIGQGLYILAIEGLQFSKLSIKYLLSVIVAFILFSPWFFIIINSYQVYTTTGSAQVTLPYGILVKTWIENISFIFLDYKALFPNESDNPTIYLHPSIYLIFFIVLIVFYSLYWLWKARKHSKLFIFILIGSSALPLILVDLYMGWSLSTFSRYLIPCWLGIQLAVAYLFSSKLFNNSSRKNQKLWLIITLSVISLEVISAAVSSQTKVLWNKGNYYNPQIASFINQSKQPVVVSYSSAMCDVLSISYSVKPTTKFLLLPILPGSEITIPNISNSDIFFLDPHGVSFRYAMERENKGKKQLVYKVDNLKLWKLSNT